MAENWVAGPTIDEPHRWTYAELEELIPRVVQDAAVNAGMDGRRALTS